jgi:hypothetical protein
MTRLGRLAAVTLVTCLAGCQAILNAPEGTDIRVSANPTFIPSNGGVSIISALLIEPNGTPVADGTVVQFFTTLGTIEEQGKTNDGVARVKLVSDSRSGEAEITVRSGIEEGDTLTVTIGNVNVAAVLLRADPSRIVGSNSTHVIATVVDVRGNPVPNVAVYFQVVDNPFTEWFDNAGRPIFTNNNGEVEDVMRTRRQAVGPAVVRAFVIGGASGNEISGELTIPIL